MAPCTGLQVMPGTVLNISSVKWDFSAKAAKTAVRSWEDRKRVSSYFKKIFQYCSRKEKIRMKRNLQLFHKFPVILKFSKDQPLNLVLQSLQLKNIDIHLKHYFV